MDTSSSLKAASDYDDDGIYVLSEDELDGQTVLDLQLELSIIKKRLRSTELAYRALVGFWRVQSGISWKS